MSLGQFHLQVEVWNKQCSNLKLVIEWNLSHRSSIWIYLQFLLETRRIYQKYQKLQMMKVKTKWIFTWLTWYLTRLTVIRSWTTCQWRAYRVWLALAIWICGTYSHTPQVHNKTKVKKTYSAKALRMTHAQCAVYRFRPIVTIGRARKALSQAKAVNKPALKIIALSRSFRKRAVLLVESTCLCSTCKR